MLTLTGIKQRMYVAACQQGFQRNTAPSDKIVQMWSAVADIERCVANDDVVREAILLNKATRAWQTMPTTLTPNFSNQSS